MAEGSEHRPRTTRPASRKRGEIVPADAANVPADAVDALPDGTEVTGPLAFIERARDVLTVRRVYGEAIERDGVTIIPAANVRGGGGGGGDAEGNGGGGFGVSASPAGAYVIKDGHVRWEPALDLNRTILVGQIVGIVALLTLRSVVKALAKRR